MTFLVTVTDRQSQSQKQFKGGKDFAHSIESMGAGSKGACHIVPIIEKKILVLRCLFAFFPLFLIIQGSCLYSECIFSRRLILSVNTDTSRANSKSLQVDSAG